MTPCPPCFVSMYVPTYILAFTTARTSNVGLTLRVCHPHTHCSAIVCMLLTVYIYLLGGQTQKAGMAVPSAHTTYVRSGTARVKSEITVSYSRSLSPCLSLTLTHTLTSSQLHTFHKAKALCTSKWVLAHQQQSLTTHTSPHTLCRVHTLALCRISNTRTLPCVYWQYSTHTHTRAVLHITLTGHLNLVVHRCPPTVTQRVAAAAKTPTVPKGVWSRGPTALHPASSPTHAPHHHLYFTQTAGSCGVNGVKLR